MRFKKERPGGLAELNEYFVVDQTLAPGDCNNLETISGDYLETI